MKLVPTASQTVGPYFRIGLEYLCGSPESNGTTGTTVRGRVLDANREPVSDAMLELWYADPQSHFVAGSQGADRNGRVPGFARIATGDEGQFSFTVPRPGPVAFDKTRLQAPHIEVMVFARGLLRHLITRMYFPDEAANIADPVLQSIPDDRRATLIARRVSSSGESLEWNIVLQGEGETVFFAW